MPHILEVGTSVGDYLLVERIGEGATSSIFTAISPDDKKVVVKCVPFANGIFENEFKREVDVLQYFSDVPQIIHLQDSFTCTSHGFIVLEKKNMDLLDYLEKGQISIENIKKIFSQICIATQQIHSSKTAHLDIKPENIFMDDIDSVVLGDFGSSFTWREDVPKKFGACGTSYYCAPEAKRKKSYCPLKADIWSLGVLLHVLFTGYWPFAAPSSKVLSRNVEKGKIKIYFDRIPKDDDTLQLLQKMLASKPKERPSISEILSSPFLGLARNELKIITKSPVKDIQIKRMKKKRSRAFSQPNMSEQVEINPDDICQPSSPPRELNSAESTGHVESVEPIEPILLRIKRKSTKNRRQDTKSWGGKHFFERFTTKGSNFLH